MAAITAVGYGEYERAVPQPHRTVSRAVSVQPPQHKDYSRPLHVDCSVEYELPNAAKPPAGARSEPLLMIHPCYYRRAESQRRSPFVNNLPPPPAGRPSIAAPAAPPLAAPAAPAHYPTQMRCYNADPRQASVAPPPKLCPSMDMHSGRWTSSIQHSPRLQHPVCHDSSGVATPCTANIAATAPVDDKINLPDVLDEIRLLVSGVHPINQQTATARTAAYCHRGGGGVTTSSSTTGSCGPQATAASYLWCPVQLRKQSRKSLIKSWDHSVKCSTVQT